MLKFVRAFIRLILFFLVSFLTVVFVAVGNIFFGMVNSKWKISWKNRIIRRWARITAIIIGIKINKSGTPPEPPFFLVSNHLSYIDVVPIWCYTHSTFIAKSDVKSWPFFGLATRILDVLFIDRELKRDVHRMNKQISSSISENQGIILFPEGTSTKGSEVQPFNSSLLQYPAENELSVSFSTISYESYGSEWPAHLNICWWGDMPFFSHFWELLKMPGFAANITFGDYRITESDRKILADKLHNAVSENFSPVVDESKIQV